MNRTLLHLFSRIGPPALAIATAIALTACGKASVTNETSEEAPGTTIVIPPQRLHLQGPTRALSGQCTGPYTLALLDSTGGLQPATGRFQVELEGSGGVPADFYLDANCAIRIGAVDFYPGMSSGNFFLKKTEAMLLPITARASPSVSKNFNILFSPPVHWTAKNLPDPDLVTHISGTVNRDFTVTLTNSGVLTTTLQNPAGSPPGNGFSFAGGAFPGTGGTCAVGTTYAPGESCTVVIRFTANARGVWSSAFSVTSSEGSGTRTQTFDLRVQTAPHRYIKKLGNTTPAGQTLCVVHNDGTVGCAGSNGSRQLGLLHNSHKGTARGLNWLATLESVPRIFDAVDVAVGSNHACALLANGTVKCWGANGNGQLGTGDTTSYPTTHAHVENDWPSVNLGTGRTAVAISSGTQFTCALLDNGLVKCWGLGASGQHAHGLTTNQGHTPETVGDGMMYANIGFAKVKQISASDTHVCAVSVNGQVKCWGTGTGGRLGNGSTSSLGSSLGTIGANIPEVQLGSGWIAIQVSAGNSHSCAVIESTSTRNRAVKCWGNNGSGQLGVGDTTTRGDNPGEMGDNLPMAELGDNFYPVEVVAGSASSCAIGQSREVKCWGANTDGRLGNLSTVSKGALPGDLRSQAATNQMVSHGPSPKALVRGSNYFCAHLINHAVKCWGAAVVYNHLFAIGTNYSSGFPEVPVHRSPFASDILTGGTATCVRWADDTGSCSGILSPSAATLSTHFLPTTLDEGALFPQQIKIGRQFGCFLTAANRVRCMGANESGQVGQGSTLPVPILSTVQLGVGLDGKSIAVGTRHACAILNNDRIKCWGNNSSGQLGYGDTANRGSAPGQMGNALPFVDLGTVSTAKELALGEDFSCALLTNNQIKCWGNNTYGQLGYGDTVNRGTDPVHMGSQLDPVDLSVGWTPATIVAGSHHVCALSTTGQMKCWGRNQAGQLGIGSTTDAWTPASLSGVNLGTGVEARQAAASATNTCVLVSVPATTGLQVRCFGLGGYNGINSAVTIGDDVAEMGDNLGAVPFSGLYSSPVKVQAGENHFCALLEARDGRPDRGVKCWGANEYGQLGFPPNSSGEVIGDAANEVPGISPIAGPVQQVLLPDVEEFVLPGEISHVFRQKNKVLTMWAHGSGGGGASYDLGSTGAGNGGAGGMSVSYQFYTGAQGGLPATVSIGSPGFGGIFGATGLLTAGGDGGLTAVTLELPSGTRTLNVPGGGGGTMTTPGAVPSGTGLPYYSLVWQSVLPGTAGGSGAGQGGGPVYSNIANLSGLFGTYPGGGGAGANLVLALPAFGGAGAPGRVTFAEVTQLLTASPSGPGEPNALDYQYSGESQFVVPHGVRRIRLQMWGGGGGGGVSRDATNAACGGGAGAWIDHLMNVEPGQIYRVQVGAGGAAISASTSSDGRNGTDSAFSGYGVNLVAGGGRGGAGTHTTGCTGAAYSAGGSVTGSPLFSQEGERGQAFGPLGVGEGGRGGNAPNGGTGGSGGTNLAGNGRYPGGGGGGTNAVEGQASGGGGDGRVLITPIYSP